MATEVRSTDVDLRLAELEAELRENTSAFEFFQAVLMLEKLRPDREGVGHFVDPAKEVVRFSSHRSISFPPGEIHSLELARDAPSRMTVNVMGVTGPLGVLPYHYTLLAAERTRAKDTAFADFLDLFHHRILSLFFRAWRKNRPAAAEEFAEDRFRAHLVDLAGAGIDAFRTGLGFDEDVLPFYAGHLGLQRRSAVGLQQLLEDYFGVPIQVEQFVGGWYTLPQSDQCALGEENGPSSQLGRGAVVGDEIWDSQSRVRIRLGPLDRAAYERFLPGAAAFEEIRALARFYGNDELEFELQLVLASDEVRGCVLGDDDARPLGWSTWIRTRPLDRDADETVLRL
jgi:type VI secretion system protein ImpH